MENSRRRHVSGFIDCMYLSASNLDARSSWTLLSALFPFEYGNTVMFLMARESARMHGRVRVVFGYIAVTET